MSESHLNAKYIGVFLYACTVLTAANLSLAASFPDKAAMEAIAESTFEVVVPKPEKDSLSYEKPLPLDLLPYTIRKDKYYPIGTAFAISPDRFVSAVHVMNLGLRSQYPQVYLRDKGGKVYAIDKFVKYSDRKDFVVFSLNDKRANTWLQINTNPSVNDRIYAVGNALGEGIVIRDGLYTSNTPENRDGEWQWIRFSAAASPGNSGGPLLDEQGKVIGIVLRKSANENLNFALPMGEVMNSKENLATVGQRPYYRLENMDMTQRGKLEKDISLPKSYSELNRELISLADQSASQLLKDLLSENKQNIFPNGAGSTRLLHQVYSATFPRLISKARDGNWDALSPSKIDNADLGNNGFLTFGSMYNSMYVRLRKPDNISMAKLFSDSKLFMDLILKGNPATRRIGPENIKITSFGKAHEEYIFTDSYQRKWQVRTWMVEYSDAKFVTLALPVPGGCIVMLRSGQTGLVDDGHIPELKTLADFIYVSYYGTLEQWREFLDARELLPPVFSSINIAFDYNKYFKYASNRFAFSYDPDLMKITRNSDLQLKFSYFNENGKNVWDVAGVVVGEDRNGQTSFAVSRNIRPPEDLSDKDRKDWEDIVNRRMPYNKTSFFKEVSTIIATVYTQKTVEKLAVAPLLYTVLYGLDGNIDQKTVEGKLDRFVQNLAVKEY